MRRLVFILILLRLAVNADAQKIRITDTTNIWNWLIYPPFPSQSYNSADSFKGFVIKNGHTYCQTKFGYLFRDDTVLHKVFTLRDSEIVLYDYNMKLGDTITRANDTTFAHVVTSIDSTLINSVWHKTWMLYCIKHLPFGGWPTIPIIEGIGCPYGLDFPFYPLNWESAAALQCFSNNGNIVTIPCPSGGNYSDPTRCASAIKGYSFPQNNPISVIPNPANETSVIRLPYNIHSGKLAILNALGQTVLQKGIANKAELPIGDLHLPGMYFYRITDNETNQTFTGKFIYQ